jgi:hypothetical protein
MPAAKKMVFQMIPKAMKSSITDSGTPNIHIINIRVITSSSFVVRSRWRRRHFR